MELSPRSQSPDRLEESATGPTLTQRNRSPSQPPAIAESKEGDRDLPNQYERVQDTPHYREDPALVDAILVAESKIHKGHQCQADQVEEW